MMNPAEFANIAASEQDFWWYRGMLRILFGLLDPIAKERVFRRVLEAGCGTGYVSKMLDQRYGWPMYPIDLDAEGLRYARSLDVQRPVQADITLLPFGTAMFDMLVSLDVVVHLPRGQEHRAFSEFARVLQPGGLAVIRVSALDLLRSKHSEFAHERQRFTRQRLVASCEEQGLHALRCTYVNSLLMPVALAKFRIWEPLTAQRPASGVQPVSSWLDHLLFAPLAAEAVILGAGINLPVGQSLLLIAEKR